MLVNEIVDAHVLVIGSGGAGVRAAIEASRYGSVILASKTIVGKGGCTTMAEGGFNAVLRDQDSIEAHREDTLSGGAYLNDPALVDVLVNRQELAMPPSISAAQTLGFSLYLLKAVIGGKGDEVIDLARTNFLPRGK